jgi:acyl dehydratase
MTQENVRGLTVGHSVTFQRQVDPETIQKFVDVSGDTNPLHVDADYAARTRFKRPIAHGMIGAAFISAAMATKLSPGHVIVYLGQNLEFIAPVYEFDVLTVSCTVTAVDARRNRVTVDTVVTNQDGAEVIRGEAKVLVDELASAEA